MLESHSSDIEQYVISASRLPQFDQIEQDKRHLLSSFGDYSGKCSLTTFFFMSLNRLL